ncbi:MAG: peptide chain release factor N(5)-glutamine methyltransferase [Alphaproteobacteria bacterium]|nr:peptide chain release factor N(5)-glutamine methyltransferase [Alphaproteobacteria bacterium]
MTLNRALAAAARRLAEAGIEDGAREARLLAQLALATDAAGLLARKGTELSAAEAAALDGMIGRRAGREPFARIAGEKEFWSLTFSLGAETLVPRPETETLVEAALERRRDRSAPARILDLGAGSGCILLALLSELPRATGLGVDASAAALAVAEANARRLGFSARAEWREGDWAEGVEGRFDLVVANPPYVATGDWASLPPEVRDHDPRRALIAGDDGLGAYRRIVPALVRLLAPAGTACLEIGRGQGKALAVMAREQGLRVLGIRRDLAGIERCVVLATGGN